MKRVLPDTIRLLSFGTVVAPRCHEVETAVELSKPAKIPAGAELSALRCRRLHQRRVGVQRLLSLLPLLLLLLLLLFLLLVLVLLLPGMFIVSCFSSAAAAAAAAVAILKLSLTWASSHPLALRLLAGSKNRRYAEESGDRLHMEAFYDNYCDPATVNSRAAGGGGRSNGGGGSSNGGGRRRNYPVVCVNYHKMWDNKEALVRALGLPAGEALKVKVPMMAGGVERSVLRNCALKRYLSLRRGGGGGGGVGEGCPRWEALKVP